MNLFFLAGAHVSVLRRAVHLRHVGKRPPIAGTAQLIGEQSCLCAPDCGSRGRPRRRRNIQANPSMRGTQVPCLNTRQYHLMYVKEAANALHSFPVASNAAKPLVCGWLAHRITVRKTFWRHGQPALSVSFRGSLL